MTSASLPVGFVGGINYFVDPGYSSGFAGVNCWQGVIVTGLSDGGFVAEIIGVSDFNWINCQITSCHAVPPSMWSMLQSRAH